jgi:hypothetical protein
LISRLCSRLHSRRTRAEIASNSVSYLLPENGSATAGRLRHRRRRAIHRLRSRDSFPCKARTRSIRLNFRVQTELPQSISMTRVEFKNAVIDCKKRKVSRKEEAGYKASSRN